MKKSIMLMLLGLLFVFAVVLTGCDETTSEEVGTQNAENEFEEASEEVTEDDKYAYLEEKGSYMGGQDGIGIQIALNEKYGMVYEEQIILYLHPECGNYGITAYDEPLVVAVDVSEFATFDCGVTLKDGDYCAPFIYGDFDAYSEAAMEILTEKFGSPNYIYYNLADYRGDNRIENFYANMFFIWEFEDYIICVMVDEDFKENENGEYVVNLSDLSFEIFSPSVWSVFKEGNFNYTQEFMSLVPGENQIDEISAEDFMPLDCEYPQTVSESQ